MSAAIDRIFDRMDQRRAQPNEPGPVQRSSAAATVIPSASKSDRFKAKEVNLFDPNPDVLLVESKSDGNIYHNVFSFTVRLRVRSQTMDAKVLNQNIDKYLIRNAQEWHTNQVHSLTRAAILEDPEGITRWISMLEERFRDSPGRSLMLLEEVKYTVNNVCQRRDPADYVNFIILNSKNTSIGNTEATQVLIALNHIDAVLRRDLKEPNESSTVANLLKELRYRKDIWFDRFAIKSNAQPTQPPPKQRDQREQREQRLPNNPFTRGVANGIASGNYQPTLLQPKQNELTPAFYPNRYPPYININQSNYNAPGRYNRYQTNQSYPQNQPNKIGYQQRYQQRYQQKRNRVANIVAGAATVGQTSR